MDLNIVFGVLGALAFLLLLVGLLKKRSVKAFMESNEDVPQLYLQKAVENKIHTITKAIRENQGKELGDEYQQLAADLHKLKEKYRNKQISLKGYDANLNRMVQKLRYLEEEYED
ncbi:hypothetical protein MUY27_03095 [Mucilaginibacter sp. RS28]|uniref:Uncharacterized protein n=1 Tax=Mucilaginibacter straminoryzae TaxID=2932774 RepID=A0A9X1X350_9SPHI|nr:hypothetical protein [Mucilaginibacter straminoryzae]MCJ8208678.1 hypothetical protein [Mucilaginibacter straminoryzae]